MLLSICIMTYNRADLLRQTLDSIIANMPDDSTEIVISDNHSQDHTAEVVNQFIASSPVKIRYFKNESNFGMDGNLLRSIERANGKYIWMFSDDDIMPSGLLKHVSAHLTKREYNLCYVAHYSFRDGDDYRKIYKTFYPVQDIEFTEGMELFKVAGFGFVSSNIYNASLAKEVAKTNKHSYNNIHIEIALKIALKKKGSFLFIGKEAVAARMPLQWNRASFFRDAYIHTVKVYEHLNEESGLPVEFLNKLRNGFVFWGIFKYLINASVHDDIAGTLKFRKDIKKAYPSFVHKLFIDLYFIVTTSSILSFFYRPVYSIVVSRRINKKR